MLRPRPIPCGKRFPCPPRTKGSNIFSCISGGIPGPVSRTRTQTQSSSAPDSTLTVPPPGVYLMALLTRLPSTWSSRKGSACTFGRDSGSFNSQCKRFFIAACCQGSSISGNHTAKSMVSRSNSNTPKACSCRCDRSSNKRCRRAVSWSMPPSNSS